MTWFKVDDKLHDHRKAAAAGVEAMGLWVLAGSWCGDNLTDGFVPCRVVTRWSPKGVKLGHALVEAGLWLVSDKDGEPGWQFHEWLQSNPSREKVLAERAAAKERQQRLRSRRDSNGRNGVTNGVSHTTPTRPDPTPVPNGTGSVAAERVPFVEPDPAVTAANLEAVRSVRSELRAVR